MNSRIQQLDSAEIQVEVLVSIRADDLQPEVITALLGLPPSHSFTKGDVVGSGPSVIARPHGLWQFRTKSHVASHEPEDHLLAILQLLEPKRDSVEAIMAMPGVTVGVRIWWEIMSETGGYTLKAATMERLAKLCHEFDFTFIGHGG